ncbi:hypothetical protein MOQ_000414 [Trypanosoma cruzi marinkellei]|uniref:ABC transmembrane type-1 domain-containing protein n=1 Tax=Trypanosoma cruzi marinkellei TaxID=85056 RepID=K2PEF5_TRYCR|nr:hypothetical protein MOQ_000414 [Trypanosoma cruzi marinkellei]
MVQTMDRGVVPNANSILNVELDVKGESWMTFMRRLCAERKGILPMTAVFLKNALMNAKAHKVSYCISFFSVFLVVFLCVILMSTIFNLPIVFLRLGEVHNGKNDLALTAGGELHSASSLNYSIVEERFPLRDPLRGFHSPRIRFGGSIVKYSTCSGIKKPQDLWYDKKNETCRGGCFEEYCDSTETQALIVAINEERETRMGFGTSWKGRKLKKGEVILSIGVAAVANRTRVGDTVLLVAMLATPLRQLFTDFPSLTRNTRTIVALKVVGIVAPDRSKFDSDDFAVLDYDTFVSLVSEGFFPGHNAEDVKKFSESNPKSCATSIHFNLGPNDRTNTYKTTDYALVRLRISSWVSSIAEPLGFNQITVNTPILNFLYTVRFFSLFVELIVSIILLSLAFLSIMLIYSLLNLSIENQVYELGVKRMIGFSRGTLVFMLFTNAYAFTIPAWIIGLIAGQVVFLGLRSVVRDIVGVNLPHIVPGQAFGWATLLGLLLPLFGALLPVMSLLKQNLPEALNSSRGRNVGVLYKIERGGYSKSVNYMFFGIGTAFAVFGFMLHYFFPIGLMHMRLGLLFYIFFGVLIGMLAGMVLLSLNFERMLQMISSYIFFFWESAAVFRAFQNCLVSHRQRNRKTTLMYAFSLGFIIFITIAFQVQLRSFQYGIRRSMGAEVVIDFEGMDLFTFSKMAHFIKAALPQVSAVTYLSDTVSSGFNIQNVSLYSPGRYQGVFINSLVAISPNYLETLNKDFLLVKNYNQKSREYSISGAVYTAKRNQIVVSSSVFSTLKSNSLEDPEILVTAIMRNAGKRYVDNVRHAVKPCAVLDAAPQVSMTKFREMDGVVLTSYPSLTRFSGVEHLSIRSIKLTTVSLRVPESRYINYVSRVMEKYVRRNRITKTSIRDDDRTAQYLGIADRILGFFFIFVQVVTLAICFFSLLSSMTANISESSKEVGIYRCIGMTKFQIHRIFIWESFVVVIASGIVGIIVGLMIGYSMQLQNYLFTQLEVPFALPYTQLLIVVIMAIGAALLASYPPVALLLHLPSITHILRRTT